MDSRSSLFAPGLIYQFFCHTATAERQGLSHEREPRCLAKSYLAKKLGKRHNPLKMLGKLNYVHCLVQFGTYAGIITFTSLLPTQTDKQNTNDTVVALPTRSSGVLCFLGLLRYGSKPLLKFLVTL